MYVYTHGPCLTTKFYNSFNIINEQQEVSRGEVANGLNCYMKQHGVTKEAAAEVMREMERENYKIMMGEFVSSKAVARQILMRPFNIARTIDSFYKEGDGFGHPDQNLKDLIASLFLHPIPL